MVKKAAAKRGGFGRPKLPPERSRESRVAIRAHVDLVAELGKIADETGMVRSLIIERAVVHFVNAFRGETVLTGVGRYAREGETARESGLEAHYTKAKARWITHPAPLEAKPNPKRVKRD